MSSSTPSKEQRAERHLMRIRGAGKTARVIDQNLFAFIIAAKPGKSSSDCAQHGRVSPSKRRKLSDDEPRPESQSFASMRCKPSLLAKPRAELSPTKAVLKARAREAAQKLFSDPPASSAGGAKAMRQTKTTIIEGMQPPLKAPLKLPRTEKRVVLVETDQHSEKHAPKTEPKSISTPLEKILQVDTKPRPSRVQKASNKVQVPVASDAVAKALNTTTLKSKKGHAIPKRKTPLSSKSAEASARLESQCLSAPESGSTTVRASDRRAASPLRELCSMVPSEADVEAQLRSISSTSRIHKAVSPPPRQALASISTNRSAVASAHGRVSNIDGDYDMDQPTKPHASYNPESLQKSRVAASLCKRTEPRGKQSTSKTLLSGTFDSDGLIVSAPRPLDKPANSLSRKRFRAPDDEDDDDVDDLIMNITTLTKGIEHHLAHHSISSISKRQKIK